MKRQIVFRSLSKATAARDLHEAEGRKVRLFVRSVPSDPKTLPRHLRRSMAKAGRSE